MFSELTASGVAPASVAVRAVLLLLPPTALAALALWKKALTSGGLVLAWVLAAAITFTGGLAGFVVLAAVFLCTIAAGKLSRGTREELESRLHAKTGRRDAVQILCNVLVGTIMLLLHALTHRAVFLWAYGGAMSASLADSLASELGVMSRKCPVDVLSLRRSEPGLSGGVTLFGLAASLLGALIVALLCLLFPACDLSVLADVAAAGFFAAFCDSVLGSAFQAKYRCPVCSALTEKPVHCGVSGRIERGHAFVTNDLVNLANNVIGALAAAALYLLHHH